VDLSQATPGPWDTTNSSGQGVYDPEQWAVIFRFTEVTIPSGVTVTFKNHPSRAPVIWLVQGNATIAGTVSLNGEQGHGLSSAVATLAEAGPGGFRGGRAFRTGSVGSAGMGPGGGGYPKSGGSYGSAGGGLRSGVLYGNDGVFPLIGGSGGSGSSETSAGLNDGGGGGGGAILIATAQTLTLNGLIRANGGANGGAGGGVYDSAKRAGGGSGGAIRLIGDVVTGTGSLTAFGGSGTSSNPGGAGRIRVEANTIALTSAHTNSSGIPSNPPRVFRAPGDGVPAITAMTLNGQPVPEDPRSYPTQDVALVGVGEDDSVLLAITAEHVPSGSAVTARVVRLSGVEEIIPAQFDGETGDESTWNAQVPVAGGFSTIQVHAVLP